MVSAPEVPLGKEEFVIRKSNRLVHHTAGGPLLPCGFFAEVIRGDCDQLSADLNDGRKIEVVEQMSSLAGSCEARARSKLVDERGEHLETRTHAGYTHDYYKIELGDLVLIEWFRWDENSAEAYLEGGFEGLLKQCQELERVLEKHLPKPAEVYDYIPSGNGIRSVYHQIYRILSKEMREEEIDFVTVHMFARLEGGLKIEPSREVRKALNQKGTNQVDLHDLYRERVSELLEPLQEVLRLVRECAGGVK